MAETEKVFVGDEPVAQIRKGGKVVFPEPLIHEASIRYDFIGRRNSDVQRAVAMDLSGNGKNGTLINFSFENGSGYINDGLKFDGVDDYIFLDLANAEVTVLEYLVDFKIDKFNYLGAYQAILALNSPTYMMIRNSDRTLFFSFSMANQETRSTSLRLEVGVRYQIRCVCDGVSLFIYNYDELIHSSPLSGGGIKTSKTFSYLGNYASSQARFDGEIYKFELKY